MVCAKCSDYRAELRYDGNRPNRVCFRCFTFLTGNVLPENKEDKRRGILEVRAQGLPWQRCAGAHRLLAPPSVLSDQPAGVPLPILLSARGPGEVREDARTVQLNAAPRFQGGSLPQTSARCPVFRIPCSCLPGPPGHTARSLLRPQSCSLGQFTGGKPPLSTCHKLKLGLAGA